MNVAVTEIEFEKETLIRDAFARNLKKFKPDQLVLAKEANCSQSNLRVDLQTVDKNEVFREWEFKLYADYKALGQILTYMALAKKGSNFSRDIIGVIAAFEFQPELISTIRTLALAIEIVKLPPWLAKAGKVRLPASTTTSHIDFKKLST
ncbi:hypothetical protein ACFU8X_29410 [Brevibacillus porteri]|uniref:hypothetical protein n=1 Tax=Brevibacillus porteri TaxID=2126350 RepID=UPI00370A984E